MKRVKVAWNIMPRTTQYEFQYRQIGSQIWSESEFVSTNYTVISLIRGISYQFRVRSICSIEISDWAYLGVNVYTNDGLCNSPTGITIEQLSENNSFLIGWNGNNNAESWNFRYRIVGTFLWTNTNLTTSLVTIGNLVVNAKYEFQIQTQCSAGTVSEWGNTTVFIVTSPNASQTCPIIIEEDWQIISTIISRKDGNNTISLSGSLSYIGSDIPLAGGSILVGNVGNCCAPLQETTIPINDSQITGEFTVTSSGQITVYIGQYKVATPALSVTLNGILYAGYEADCS